jgi:predicted aspartyl protease
MEFVFYVAASIDWCINLLLIEPIHRFKAANGAVFTEVKPNQIRVKFAEKKYSQTVLIILRVSRKFCNSNCTI